jgi:hypothetical protein
MADRAGQLHRDGNGSRRDELIPSSCRAVACSRELPLAHLVSPALVARLGTPVDGAEFPLPCFGPGVIAWRVLVLVRVDEIFVIRYWRRVTHARQHLSGRGLMNEAMGKMRRDGDSERNDEERGWLRMEREGLR